MKGHRVYFKADLINQVYHKPVNHLLTLKEAPQGICHGIAFLFATFINIVVAVSAG